MNTGFVRPAKVATALTVYGIETRIVAPSNSSPNTLQQHLPFTVLKRLVDCFAFLIGIAWVATVLTVYGMRRRVRGSRGVKRR